MLRLIETTYITHCGCSLKQEDLLLFEGLFVCPVHKKRVRILRKYCARCGDLMTITNAAVKQLYCISCGKVLDQARTTRCHYDLEKTIDPGISQKSPKEISADIMLNALIGWEEIQIDPPRKSQFTAKKIKIDLRKKAKQFRNRTHSQKMAA